MPRHSPYALLRLNFLCSILLEFAYNLFYNEKAFFTLFFFLGFAYLSICGQIVVPRFSKRPWFLWSQFLFLNPVKLSVRFSYLVFNEHSFCCRTFWVSAMVEMKGIEPLPPCLQGRCSPSWATPPYLGLNSPWKSNNKSIVYKTLSRRFCFLCEFIWTILFQSFLFSIERRWSSRTFRYGYLVTT